MGRQEKHNPGYLLVHGQHFNRYESILLSARDREGGVDITACVVQVPNHKVYKPPPCALTWTISTPPVAGQCSSGSGDSSTGKVLMASSLNMAVREAVPASLVVEKASPIALAKALKNTQELQASKGPQVHVQATLSKRSYGLYSTTHELVYQWAR